MRASWTLLATTLLSGVACRTNDADSLPDQPPITSADSGADADTDTDGGSDTDSGSDTDVLNTAPMARDDVANTSEDRPVSIDVLANDTDPDGDALTVTDIGAAAAGTVVLESDGTVTYTPAANVHGTDAFTYTAVDVHGATATADVNVTVLPVNDAPDAGDDVVSTDEDVSVLVDVLANDGDVDGDVLSLTAVGAPSQGTATIEGTEVRYTPATDTHGTDLFEVTISDGVGETSTTTVTVTVLPVNDLPVARDDAATTEEDTAVNVDVLANDSDVDDAQLTLFAVGAPSVGNAVLASGGAVTVTPPLDFVGTITVPCTVQDASGGQAESQLTVTVTPVNDAPVAADLEGTLDEDTAIEVLIDATDVDGDALSYTVIDGPTAGELTGVGPSFTYTPQPDSHGPDTATVRVADGQGGEQDVTIRLTVVPVNDAPVAADDSASLEQDKLVDLVLSASDVDGDALTYAIAQAPTNGEITGTPPTVTYTPDPGYVGADSFTFRADDGNESDVGTVTLDVTRVVRFEAWVLQNRRNGKDSELDLVVADNYAGAGQFEDIQSGDGFGVTPGMCVNADYDVFFFSNNLNKLFGYDYDTPGKRFEVSVGGVFQQQGIACVDDRIYLRTNAGNGQISIHDQADGSLLRSVSSGVPTSSEGALRYSHTTDVLYWPRLVGGNIDLYAFDVGTEKVTVTQDLLPPPISSSSVAPKSYTMDFEGNHYLMYFTDFNAKDARVMKYSPELDVVWALDVNFGVTRGSILTVDAQRNVYVTEDGGSKVYVRKFETDAAGDSPVEVWRTLVHTSNTTSPAIVELMVEDDPDGRVLTLHAVSGGLRSFRKSDGGGVRQTFASGRGTDFVVLPGRAHAVP